MTNTTAAAALRALGAQATAVDELLRYTAPRFDQARLDALTTLPLLDEPHIAVWREYAAEAGRDGAVTCLRRRLAQLAFPIAPETQARDDYRAATRLGIWPPDSGDPAPFVRGEAVELFVHPTPAGHLPVVVAPERADFGTIISALTHRNAPAPLPPALGACMIAGYTNADRVRRALDGGPSDSWPAGGAVRAARLRALRDDPTRYQDQFIVLSAGPYSAVGHEALGLAPAEWLSISRTIRLEHECAHYFTKRVFGTMRNALHDELIADYVGIRSAVGTFRATWFLQFMGLERHPDYRPGGRLEHYVGDPPLSGAAFHTLGALMVAVAAQVERFDHAAALAGGAQRAEWAADAAALASSRLEALAAPDGHLRLAERAAHLRRVLGRRSGLIAGAAAEPSALA